MGQKMKLKSKAYLKWIAQQPCAICETMWVTFGKQPTCPQETVVDHHLIPKNNGTRRSMDFNNAIPLGYNHHTGKCGVHTKFKKEEREHMEFLRTIAELYTREYENR